MNDDYLKSDEHKKKMEELAQRCAEFMKDFAPPSPYELGFKAGWEAAKKEFQKDNTYVPDTTKGPYKTMDIMWPDRMPTTLPFPPSYYVNRCGTCNIEFKGVMGYVCNHPNCPTKVTC